MRTIYIMTACGWFFACQPALSQSHTRVLKLEFVETREVSRAGRQIREVMDRIQFLAPDGRQRTEIRDPNSLLREVEIQDPVRDVAYQLDWSQRLARRWAGVSEGRRRGQHASSDAAVTGGEQGEDLGQRSIQGFECRGLRHKFSGDAHNPIERLIEAWSCRDPVSGAFFVGGTRIRLPNGQEIRRDLQRVTRDVPVDNRMFEVPPDFRVVN